MRKLRTLLSVVICLLLLTGLVACGSGAQDAEKETTSQAPETTAENKTEATQQTTQQDTKATQPEKTEAVATTAENTTASNEPSDGKRDTLVVVFSATGTTKKVAEKIAEYENADFYEILAAEPYSDADRNWNDKNSRTTIEQNDASSRPAIGSETISLEGYKTIYIGYPIWWAIEPRIMDTFVESYNFDGITMIPFCTSGSSGIGNSGKNLAEHAGSGNWLDGTRFAGNVSDEKITSWIDGLK